MAALDAPSRDAPSLRQALELKPHELRRRLDPASLPFRTTAEVEPLAGTVGQPRALGALELGLEIPTRGYNVFVAGAPGSGRSRTVLDELRAVSRTRPAPADWVYVNNFHDPDRPRAIRLPAGRGSTLAHDMDEFVAAALREIPRALESDEYDRRQRELVSELTRRRHELTEELKEFAAARSYQLDTTPVGVVTGPVVDGESLTAERFAQLPEPTRNALAEGGKEIEERTATYLRAVHQLEKAAAARVQDLQREVARFAVGALLHDLNERYADEPAVLEHLAQVEEDLLAHVDEFRDGDESAQPALPLPFGRPSREFARYRVNVLVDNSATEGAPVVVEPNPTYYNLLGRVEYRGTFGAMVTDFREIKAGALHRANGGFFVLELLDVASHPFAWQALKRALRAGEVRIENLGEEFSAVPSASLRPEPIALDVKVVLIGPSYAYQLLYGLDEDFRELFRVKADFAPEMAWSADHHAAYAAFVSRCVRDEGLRHFSSDAVAALIEHGARLREHQRKLSTRLLEIADVVTEASFLAGRMGHELVDADDVQRAIEERDYRSNLLEERLRELVADGAIVIETTGSRVGRLNGLSVIDLGDYAFAHPSRVSAQVGLGKGELVSIEREIELSGPIHSKGFLTLAGYLTGTYGHDRPLSLSARVTFEQSYGGVEGDSASSTELYALLSALSGLPLDQGIAVTGSVDQHGDVQAVGAVTRKVEGFYAACKLQGLTGAQGVIVPRANLVNLMLSEEVVDAVERGEFHVWAVSSVDEGIELLTGRPAGERESGGEFPERSVHALVQARVRELDELARELAASERGGE
jgi:predicted ATP-dependent protease